MGAKSRENEMIIPQPCAKLMDRNRTKKHINRINENATDLYL